MPISAPTTSHHEIKHWAIVNDCVPAEIIEHSIDHNPAILQVIHAGEVRIRPELRQLSWEEFFLKFDALGLSFVYDDDFTGYNEILQIDEKSAYRHPEYRKVNEANLESETSLPQCLL